MKAHSIHTVLLGHSGKTTVFIRTVCAVLLLACLGACSIYKGDVPQGNIVSSEQLSGLKVGMSRAQVQQTLGSPLLQDVFNAQRWDYVYRSLKGTGQLEQRVLTVFFDDKGFVTRWTGQEAPDQPLLSQYNRPVQASSNEPNTPAAPLSADLVALAKPGAVLPVAANNIGIQTPVNTAVSAPSAPVTNAAASTTVKPSAPASASSQMISNRVETWRQAWVAKNTKAYAEHYIDGYKGDAGSAVAWVAQRQRVFDAAGEIKVALSDVQVLQTSDSEARVTFTQQYQSSRLKETGEKNLFFQRVGAQWKIVAERFVKAG